MTLTVSGELDEPDPDELDDEDEDDGDEDAETYELLVSFMVDEQEYGLYIPPIRSLSSPAWWMARRNWWRVKPLTASSLGLRRNWRSGVAG